MKGANMSRPRVKTQSKTVAQNQQTEKSAERKERRLAMERIKVKRWVSQRLANKAPVKLLGALAAGAMLIAGTAFIYRELNQDIAGSPPSSSETTTAMQSSAYWVEMDEAEEMLSDELSASFYGVLAPAGSETTTAMQSSAYWVEMDEAEEMLSDELSASFYGVLAPAGSETTQAILSPAYWVEMDEAEEMLSDELSASFIGVPAPSSHREAVLEWQRSHLTGVDRLDDQIAAGLEAGDEAYRPFMSDYADEVGSPASRE
jgi:hypothetical protein